MNHQLTLGYTIPTGDLTPYFDALRNGKALASACNVCGLVAFPARVLCTVCKGGDTKWLPLEGTAHIVFRTEGDQKSYALVQFDGADTTSTVALTNPDLKTTFGTLKPLCEEQSGLWLTLDDTNTGDNNER